MTLLPLHLRPINVVVSYDPQGILSWEGFARRCFQRLSCPNVATQHCTCAAQLVHQRFVQPGPLVLRSDPSNFLVPTTDRDRTVSRRSEPSSRATFNRRTAEPLGLLQPGCDEPTYRGPNRRVDMSSWRRSACYPRVPFIL